jgi:hypothetical protein
LNLLSVCQKDQRERHIPTLIKTLRAFHFPGYRTRRNDESLGTLDFFNPDTLPFISQDLLQMILQDPSGIFPFQDPPLPCDLDPLRDLQIGNQVGEAAPFDPGSKGWPGKDGNFSGLRGSLNLEPTHFFHYGTRRSLDRGNISQIDHLLLD